MRSQEKGSCSCDLIYIIKNIFHGNNRFCSPMFRTDNQFAILVGPSENDQGCCFNGFIMSELFNLLMNHLSVFETDNEYSSLFCL